MGGKNKQSQRTKNNVRPSSSGRSAELLSSAGKFEPSAAGGSGKLMPALFPTLAAVTLDASLNPELAMCIKKLNKKDPITKTKALQELTELVNKSSVDNVEAALPGWSHFYKTLSVDMDSKVRECTQVCHGAIVRVCGRRVAPHLKQLLPAWLQAQYDDHAPAQAQAQLSLKNTFPDTKLPEVIAFCKTEILDSLEDNLIGAAADGHQGCGAAAALHGLAWTARHAPRALRPALQPRLLQLLAHDALWRLAAHQHYAVRYVYAAPLRPALQPRLLQLLAHDALWRLAAHQHYAVRYVYAAPLRPALQPRLLQLLAHDALWRLAAHQHYAVRYVYAAPLRPALQPRLLQLLAHDALWRLAAHQHYAVRYVYAAPLRPALQPRLLQLLAHDALWRLAAHQHYAVRYVYAAPLRPALQPRLLQLLAHDALWRLAAHQHYAVRYVYAAPLRPALQPRLLQLLAHDALWRLAAHQHYAVRYVYAAPLRPALQPRLLQLLAHDALWRLAAHQHYAVRYVYAAPLRPALQPRLLQLLAHDALWRLAAHQHYAVRYVYAAPLRPALQPRLLQLLAHDALWRLAAHQHYAVRYVYAAPLRPALQPRLLQLLAHDALWRLAAHQHYAVRYVYAAPLRPALQPRLLQLLAHDALWRLAAHQHYAVRYVYAAPLRPALQPRLLQLLAHDALWRLAAHQHYAVRYVYAAPLRPALQPRLLQLLAHDALWRLAAHQHYAVRYVYAAPLRPALQPRLLQLLAHDALWRLAAHQHYAVRYVYAAPLRPALQPRLLQLLAHDALWRLAAHQHYAVRYVYAAPLRPALQPRLLQLLAHDALWRLAAHQHYAVRYVYAAPLRPALQPRLLQLLAHDALWRLAAHQHYAVRYVYAAPLRPALQPRLLQLLAHDALWRLAAHQHYAVRAAWFSAMGSVVEQYWSSLDTKTGTRLLRVLLTTREAEPRAAAQLWGCLLLCMHTVPDWHSWLDKKDLLAKRILNLLENGGWGEARELTNMLLPLLASLPPDMLTPQFYEEFFNAIFTGLDKKGVINSKIERQAWITALAECLRYVSGRAGPELCGGVLRRWLQAALLSQRGPPAASLLKHSAVCMTELLKYWMRKAREEGDDRYSALVRNFWQNVCCAAPAADALDAHVLLLTTLRGSFLQDQRKQHSIRFQDEEPAPSPRGSPPPAAPPADAQLFHHQLAAAAELLCARYIELARDTGSPIALLPPLSPLLHSLSRASIEAVARHVGAASTFDLFAQVVQPWLADERTRGEPVVDLAFLLLPHMTEPQQDAAFAAFSQEPVCSWAARRALCHPHVRAAAARRWLRGAAVGGALRRAAGRHDDDAARRLLLQALTPADDDEMLVSPQTVSAVVEQLSGALQRGGEPLCLLCAQLATGLAPRPPDTYPALLLALFQLNLTVHRGAPELSVETWEEARGAWADGLAALADRGPPLARGPLLGRAALLLRQRALATTEELDIPVLEHAASLCPYLVSECELAAPLEAEALLQRLLAPPPPGPALDVFALRHDVIVSKLSCPFADDNEAIAAVVADCDKDDVDELTKPQLVSLLSELVFRALCVRAVLLHRGGGAEGGGGGGGWGGAVLAGEPARRRLCALLRDYVVLLALHEGYAFWPHYEIIERAKTKLDAVVQDIIDETPICLRGQILASLSERAATDGYYWAYARSCYEAKAADRSGDRSADGPDAISADLDKLAEVVTGNGLYHSLQANLHWQTTAEPLAELRAAHGVMLRAARAALAAEDAPAAALEAAAGPAAADDDAGPDLMLDLYYMHEKVMLGDRDPREAPWPTVVCSAAAAEYLARLLRLRGWAAAAHHWDFATISLCALLAALRSPMCTKTAMLCVSGVRLLQAVREFVLAVPARSEREQPASHVAALPAEWRDIFSPDIHTNLFDVIVQLLESPPAGPTSLPRARALAALAAAARGLQWAQLPAPLRAGRLALRPLTATCAAALAAPAHRAYKYLAHATLMALSSDLVLEDAAKLSAWSERNAEGEEGGAEGGEGGAPPLCVTYFHDSYLGLLEMLDAALANIQVGEATCEMAAGSAGRGAALGALLLCDALHAAVARARGDLTHHYIQIFREKYTDLLLSCSMRLLPGEVFAFTGDSAGGQPLAERLLDLFVSTGPLTVDEPETRLCGGAGDVGALACRGVLHALRGPGQAAARAVWAAWPARAARRLARLTAAAVAPLLLREQFAAAAKRATSLPDTQLTLLPAAREAQAVHTVEDTPLRLSVTFSREHPLSPPRVVAPAVGPAAGTHWLQLYLGYQNGDLVRAVSLWVSAVDARVERAPQCCICYCRLHPSEGVLPKAFCNQCKNKFHKVCLRKWFTTSKKSNCPVCRAMF